MFKTFRCMLGNCWGYRMFLVCVTSWLRNIALKGKIFGILENAQIFCVLVFTNFIIFIYHDKLESFMVLPHKIDFILSGEDSLSREGTNILPARAVSIFEAGSQQRTCV